MQHQSALSDSGQFDPIWIKYFYSTEVPTEEGNQMTDTITEPPSIDRSDILVLDDTHFTSATFRS